MAESGANPSERPVWLIPIAAFLFFTIAGGMMFLFIRQDQEHQGPPFAKALDDVNGRMVIVPAGPFLYGEHKDTFILPSFYIDVTEVSNRVYADFAKAMNRPLPEGFVAARPELPVVNVTLDDARAFAKWAHKRLPNAREWEKAARGTDGRLYPWGMDRGAAAVNMGKNALLLPVTALDDGASPVGALNMLGNAAEWVEGFGAQGKPAIRGGSYLDYLYESMTWFETVPADGYHTTQVGFRCAKDAQ
jgi:serine/threonine-protein kinase